MRDSICNDCVKRTRCDMAEIGRSPLAISTCYGYEKGNPTHADRIRAMTDEELANFLMDVASRGGIQTESGIARWTLIDWLKEEAEDEQTRRT